MIGWFMSRDILCRLFVDAMIRNRIACNYGEFSRLYVDVRSLTEISAERDDSSDSDGKQHQVLL